MEEVKVSEFRDILMEHEKLIYHVINRLGIRDPEKEFYQEAVIALWKAAETYDEARGKFSSYAYFLMEKALMSLMRKQNKLKEIDAVYEASVTSEAIHTRGVDDSILDPYLLRQIKQELTANQMKWFKLFVLEDLTLKEIAEREKVTVDAVKNWGRHAKKKIRRLIDIE